MTTVIAIALAALLLLAAWLLGQLPAAAKRMAVAFGLASVGAAIVRLAERQQVGEAAMLALLAGAALGAVATAVWLMQPWLWGIEDWLAEMDAQAGEGEEEP